MSPLCVFATSSVPPGIRGAMNQWMLEILPGIFVGRLSNRVRESLWESLRDALAFDESAYASLIRQDDSEQGYRIETVGDHRYQPANFDGLQLITVEHHSRNEAGLLEGLPSPDW